MKSFVLPVALLTMLAAGAIGAINPPQGPVSRSGDQSVVLHWDRNTETNLFGYRVYRSLASAGPFTLLSTSLLSSPSYCDLRVTNGVTYYYQVTAVSRTGEQSTPSATLAVAPHLFASDDEFLDYVQQTSFDYFWYQSNPTNGMVPDRSSTTSPCSIAAVGFGLTAIGIGIDHGWITRAQGRARVLTTLTTFLQGPQGSASSGTIGYHGWFYHFLDMNTALRYTPFNTELSSIDTALLLGGILYAKQYFDGPDLDEVAIRSASDAIFSQVDWNWMANGSNVLSMGWQPTSGFLTSTWIGYDEAMLLYCLGLGTPTTPLPTSAWSGWTSGYTWTTNYGFAFIPFPPLFGHQYSHCWIDFRHIADAYMIGKKSSYFENSRRATLAQRAYCIANPGGKTGYGSNVWGLTACDGPSGYAARGAPPAQNDDGTIAPTAPGGSVPFAPEYAIPALRTFYDRYRTNIWTGYGFRDAFNLGVNWWGPDVLGIDQGPIVIMIENYRSQKVWRLFMKNEEVQRGLKRAGFVPLSFNQPRLEALPEQAGMGLSWDAVTGNPYQVEFSPDTEAWFQSAAGYLVASNPVAKWEDTGPPVTPSAPVESGQRFYRVFQFGSP
jgi:hypothetical protein